MHRAVLREAPRVSAWARVRLPDGTEAMASPGSLLGRTWTADLRIDDGRISEAHALFSLRGDLLVLLALRGRLRTAAGELSRIELRPELKIELAPELFLEILEVMLPETVLALRVNGGPTQLLTGVSSIIIDDAPRLLAGYHPGAAAVVWGDGIDWKLQRAGQPLEALCHGDEFMLGTCRVEAVATPLRAAALADTHPRKEGAGPLQILSRYDSVQIWRADAAQPLLLRGQQARLVGELISVAGPLRWELVAGALWRGESDRNVLRHRLDVMLGKVRRQLEAHGIRRDLLSSHRDGHLELLLYPGDKAEERG